MSNINYLEDIVNSGNGLVVSINNRLKFNELLLTLGKYKVLNINEKQKWVYIGCNIKDAEKKIIQWIKKNS